MAQQRYPQPSVLRKRRDFLRVQREGRRYKHRHLLLLVAKNPMAEMRVGYTVSRKVGGAVVRNRVRRRFREIVRTHPEYLKTGCDYVIIAFADAAQAEFSTLQEELLCLLQRARP